MLCTPVPGGQCFIDAVQLESVVTPGQEVLLAGSPGEIKGKKALKKCMQPPLQILEYIIQLNILYYIFGFMFRSTLITHLRCTYLAYANRFHAA